MKGFIEVKAAQDNLKMLLAVNRIIAVEEIADRPTFIVVKDFLDKKNHTATSGYSVVESYEEIVAKIIAATK